MFDRSKWDLSPVYPDNLKTMKRLDESAWPCGYIAKFFFNDRFTHIRSTDRSFSVAIDDSDIASTNDRENRFKLNADKVKDKAYWLDPTDEHVMVWYQMESLSDFIKLYGRIDGTLKAGKTYVFTI